MEKDYGFLMGLPNVSDEEQARKSWGDVNTDAIKQMYLQAFPPKPGEPIEPWDPVSAIPKLLAHYGILQSPMQPGSMTLGGMANNQQTQSMASGPMASRTR